MYDSLFPPWMQRIHLVWDFIKAGTWSFRAAGLSRFHIWLDLFEQSSFQRKTSEKPRQRGFMSTCIFDETWDMDVFTFVNQSQWFLMSGPRKKTVELSSEFWRFGLEQLGMSSSFPLASLFSCQHHLLYFGPFNLQRHIHWGQYGSFVAFWRKEILANPLKRFLHFLHI